MWQDINFLRMTPHVAWHTYIYVSLGFGEQSYITAQIWPADIATFTGPEDW